MCEPVVDAAEAFRGGRGGEVAVMKQAVVGVSVVDQLRFGEGLGAPETADGGGYGERVVECAKGIEVHAKQAVR